MGVLFCFKVFVHHWSLHASGSIFYCIVFLTLYCELAELHQCQCIHHFFYFSESPIVDHLYNMELFVVHRN